MPEQNPAHLPKVFKALFQELQMPLRPQDALQGLQGEVCQIPGPGNGEPGMGRLFQRGSQGIVA